MKKLFPFVFQNQNSQTNQTVRNSLDESIMQKWIAMASSYAKMDNTLSKIDIRKERDKILLIGKRLCFTSGHYFYNEFRIEFMFYIDTHFGSIASKPQKIVLTTLDTSSFVKGNEFQLFLQTTLMNGKVLVPRVILVTAPTWVEKDVKTSIDSYS